MRIISKKTLRLFWRVHPQAEGPLKAWHSEAKVAAWTNPGEATANYRSASALKGDRVVYRLGGNKYRLVVGINYHTGVVFVRFVGTHAEYDKTDAETV